MKKKYELKLKVETNGVPKISQLAKEEQEMLIRFLEFEIKNYYAKNSKKQEK